MELSMAEEILDEVVPSLETLETQSAAVLQFLKEKGIATDEQLAPYIEQARNASNIRWRAARLRIYRLLAPAFEKPEESREIKSAESDPKAQAESGEEHPDQTASSQPERGKEVGKPPVKATTTRTKEHQH